MDGNWAFYCEIALVYGSALAWGFYELYSLRRHRLKQQKETPEESAEKSGEGVERAGENLG